MREVTAIGPGHPAYGQTTATSIALCLLDKPLSLVAASALKGFPALQLFHLQKLYTLLKLKAKPGEKRPTTTDGCKRAIIQHLFPDMSHEDVSKIIVMDGDETDEAGLEKSCAFIPGVWDSVASCVVDEETAALIAEQHKKKQLQREKKQQRLAEMAAAAAPPVPAPAPQKLPIAWVPGRGLKQPEAKKYLPEGARIKKMVAAKRWQVEAPWLVPSRSKAYTDKMPETDNSALLHVLVEVWAVCPHAAECPWRLELDELF